MTGKPLRSARWFEAQDLPGLGHRWSFMQMSNVAEDWAGKPVIAIVSTWSEINPCHARFRPRAEDVRRGVLQAGGFPVELPALSLGENFVKPTAMLCRNLPAMEVEELLRSLPVDGAVLMAGCDKTTSGMLPGAISMDLPAIFVPAGPMLRGNLRGELLGSGSDAWKCRDDPSAGKIGAEEGEGVAAAFARSCDHCVTNGMAITMTATTEALGLTLPGASSIPAADANHVRMCAAAGRRPVEMVRGELRPSSILTRGSFENAIAFALALGCSTNAIVHLIAEARRAGHEITLADFEKARRKIPVLANVRPLGAHRRMEDSFHADGLPALMWCLGGAPSLGKGTVSGRTLGADISGAGVWNEDVIRSRDNPVHEDGALALPRGNLAPDGCVTKPSACAPKFLEHRGPAIVFDSHAQMKAKIDDPGLEVREDTVLVMRGAGPQGGPGMPEWGMIPFPQEPLKAGVRDMLRVSDARMSGTGYGACILHVAPEAHIGGPRAMARTGDVVSVNVPARRIDMEAQEEELDRRRAAWKRPAPRSGRGYGGMFTRRILQADKGCDFDLLETTQGPSPGEPTKP